MAFLEINGYELPPCKRGVSIIVTTIVNSGRDANGAVVGQKVGRDQYKIDGLEWAWLTAEEWVTENGTPTHYKDCKVNLIDTGE